MENKGRNQAVAVVQEYGPGVLAEPGWVPPDLNPITPRGPGL